MANKCPKCQTDNPEESKFCKECAASLTRIEGDEFTKTLETPTGDLSTGTTYAGRYQIIEELGKGGMGRVFKVHDTEINEKIALKLINPAIASDKNTIERFRNELKAARQISHKNVCRMFDLNKEKGHYYITMEYVSGEDLKSMIQMTGGLTAGTAVSIAKQICDGLSEAHSLGIVHRDLKPNNIMIDKGGNARIMDFGIARTLKGKAITGSGVMIGTPEYMSPEQVEGKDVDLRSDIYSLGIILYEMVTGGVPFEGSSPFTIGIKQKSEKPTPPAKINPRISEDLNRLILRCLEKDKEKRFQNAGEVRSALDLIEKGLPTTERAIPKPKPVTSREITVSFNIKKYLIPVVLTAAAAVVALFIWSPWAKKTQAPIPSDKPTLAILYFENNTGDETLEYLRSGLSEWFITDLSQSRFLNVITGDGIYSTLKKLNLLDTDKYSSEDLTRVAEMVYADHILKGSYIKVGDNFVITAMLQKPGTNETVSSRQVRCRGEEEIPDKVDELTRQIKQDLELTPQQIAVDIDAEVGQITTTSPEAFKFYSEGRKFHHETEYRKSIEMMERATELDPQFAMAFRSMGASYSNLLLFAEGKKFTQKAFELKDRLPERERYLIEGEFFRDKETTYAEAIESYSRLLDLYPDDLIGNTNLGIVYSSIEEWDMAIKSYEVLTKANDPAPFSVMNLAEAYRAQGLYDKAQAALEYYRDNIADNAVIHAELCLHYFSQGKYVLARDECGRALSLDPDNTVYQVQKGWIAQCQGNLQAAEEIYLEVLESEELGYHLYIRIVLGALHFLRGQYSEVKNQFNKGIELAAKLQDKWWEATSRIMLAFTHMKTGNFQEALEEVELAYRSGVEQESLRWQERALFVKGLAQVEMKALAEAENTAEELREFIEKGKNTKKIRDYYQLKGLIELEKNNISQAISHFETAEPLLQKEFSYGPFDCDQAIFAEPRALAYFRSGNLEKAKEEYEKNQSFVTGKLYYGDVYLKSFYMLGRIFEQEGNTAKAIENYEKFLELWKDADPGIAEVTDTKNRLAALVQKK
jgi:serine/threonine protein kinase/tetratricopeptide (TPR) repeat protein